MSLSDDLDIADAALARIRAAVVATVPVPVSTRVRAGEDLQAALAKGGAVTLEAGATFEGSFVFRSNTTLTAAGPCAVHGRTDAAIIIPPGTRNVSIDGPFTFGSAARNRVIHVGTNDATQTALDQVPEGIAIRGVTVTGYRGKRALELHARQAVVDACAFTDIFDPDRSDSQAIYVCNTPGDIQITRTALSAGSECFLVGGDHTQIPGVIPTGILLEACDVFRPLAWQTDGVYRKVKNLVELKSGRQVTIRRCQIHGCWAQGQAGEALMFTPAIGGDPRVPIAPSGIVRDVLVENCDVFDVGSIANISGRDKAAYTAEATTGIVFNGNRLRAERARFGGRGELGILMNEPGTVDYLDNDVDVDGSSLVYGHHGTVSNADGTTRVAGKIGRLRLLGNRIRTVGPYGLNLGGVANARDWMPHVEALEVERNIFVGSTTMRTLFPHNEWGTGV